MRRRSGTLRTGPRTTHGKRRSALNRSKNALCPPSVEQEFRARGEDPEPFYSLCRDLASWLVPDDASSRRLVGSLAEAWWEKLKRIRDGAGPDDEDRKEIDLQIDNLLQLLAWSLGQRHRKWRHRWESALGVRPFGPTHVRLILESRIPALGGKPPARQAVRSFDAPHNLSVELLQAVSRLHPAQLRASRHSKSDSHLKIKDLNEMKRISSLLSVIYKELDQTNYRT
jgi:hypothetical protein